MITNKILGIYWNGQELVVPMWLRIFVVILCLLVVVILILDFILCCFLFYFGAYKIVGCIVFATGLVLMFSGIIWIISFPVFIGGIAILFIPEQFSLRKK